MNNLMSELRDASKSDFEKYCELPLSVYVAAENGDIIYYNLSAKNLLELESYPQESLYNIETFYSSRDERLRLLEKFKKMENGAWEKNRTLNFRINDKKTTLRFFSKIYKSEEGKYLGSLCLVFKITGVEIFTELEENVPIGLFEISNNNLISHSNEKFRNILELDETDNNVSITNFITENSIRDMFTELRNTHFLKDRVLEITKKSGGKIFGKINLQIKEISNEKIYKVIGSLEDITYSEILRDLQNLHIGLFTVKQENNSLILLHCNDYFKKIFEGNFDNSYINRDLSTLINNKNEYDKLIDEIINANSEDHNFKNKLLKAKFGSNSYKDLNLHLKKLPQTNNTIKYTGAIYDVTDDIEKNLKELEVNFGSFLHSYSAMANNFKDTLQSIIDAHGTEVVQNNKIDSNLGFQKVINSITAFKTLYNKYFESLIDKALFEKGNSDIQKHLQRLGEQINNTNESKYLVGLIRKTFIRIKTIFEEQGPNEKVSNQILKDVRFQISEVFRYTRLLSLNYLENEAFEMCIDIEEFKEALRAKATNPENKEFNLRNAISRSVQYLTEFAERKGIHIRQSYNPVLSVKIKGDERNLFTAFYNILNNAIKYSWSPKSDDKWNLVTIQIIEGIRKVEIKFENKGVGINDEELVTGKIFKFGNRGDESQDRNRRGNGIGLWHAKNIIDQFGGTIKITSTPIENTFFIDKKPYLTVVTVTIPTTN